MTDTSGDSFEELFKAEEKRKIKKLEPGQKIRAIIVGIGEETTFLDVGGKSEGILNSSELRDADGTLSKQVGDHLDVYYLRSRTSEQLFTTSIGSGGGNAHLEEAWRSAIPVEGLVKAEIKGGFEVTLGGSVRAFCPFSQMGLRRVEDAAGEYTDKKMQFLISRYDENGRNIVVSARAIQERERAEQRQKLVENLQEGQIVEGVISSIRDFGAFVDLGGVDGLIPISEIGWSRVERVSEYFTVGQKVQAVIKKLDWEKDRISLSYKETQADPWQEAATTLHEGSIHLGTVVRLAQFGAFVNIAPGVDGLIHISKLGAGRRLNHPREVLEEGQSIEVKIDKIDLVEKRISLLPAEYVSQESKDAQEREEFSSFLKTDRSKPPSGEIGSLGALLQAKLGERKK